MTNEEGIFIGRIKEVQLNGESVDQAKKGDEVAISMQEPTFGRQIKDGQFLFTKVLYEDEKLLKGQHADLINDGEKSLLLKISEIRKNFVS